MTVRRTCWLTAALPSPAPYSSPSGTESLPEEPVADDDHLDAVWHAEECSDEHMENCPCIIATGDGDRIKYVADAETPALAARIVADHNELAALREQLAQVTAFCAQRAEYVTNLRECSPGNNRDYYRWSGHAEARRQLSRLLGLPVGWPAEDKAVPA